jgi:hypothetical protein
MTDGSDDATDGGGGFTFTITGEDGNQPRVKLLWQMTPPLWKNSSKWCKNNTALQFNNRYLPCQEYVAGLKTPLVSSPSMLLHFLGFIG